MSRAKKRTWAVGMARVRTVSTLANSGKPGLVAVGNVTFSKTERSGGKDEPWEHSQDEIRFLVKERNHHAFGIWGGSIIRKRATFRTEGGEKVRKPHSPT